MSDIGRPERQEERHGHSGRGRAPPKQGTDLKVETKRYIVELLRNARTEEVRDILNQIGFRYNTALPKPSAEQIEPALAAESHKYLDTAEGRSAMDRRRAEMVESEAKRYLSTPEGRKRVEKAIAQLAANRIPHDDDLLNRLCHEAAQREVDIWLKSHRGQTTVSNLLEQAIDEEILAWAKLERVDWIQLKLRELKRGEGGS